MQQIVSREEAEARIAAKFRDIGRTVETVALEQALGRILAADVIATADVPGFDRSSMDGYALRAADVFGASQALPAMLELAGNVEMGKEPAFSLAPGQCAAIPTGGQLPTGADAIVMIEESAVAADGTILIEGSAAPGRYVVFRGDDVKAGERILPRGRRISPQDIGTLAAVGCAMVSVFWQPVVGILSSGDEIVPHTDAVSGAQVRDVNSRMLAAAVTAAGGKPLCCGIIKDDKAALANALAAALESCDMVLLSGGSSVGTLDLTREVIDEAGMPGVFIDGVAIKPGKPTLVGDCGGKPVFGLPGHPVSAYFMFRLLVAPLLARLAGATDTKRMPVLAILAENVSSHHGREEYLAVTLEEREGQLTAIPLPAKSGLISTLTRTDGYIRVARNREGINRGDTVAVLLF